MFTNTNVLVNKREIEFKNVHSSPHHFEIPVD